MIKYYVIIDVECNLYIEEKGVLTILMYAKKFDSKQSALIYLKDQNKGFYSIKEIYKINE